MSERPFGSGADTPPILRDALDAARTQAPTTADLARLAARLPLGPGGSGPIGGPRAAPSPNAPAPAAGSAPTPPLLSGLATGALVGAVLVGAALLWPSRADSPAVPQSSATTSVTAEAAAAEAAAAAPATPPIATAARTEAPAPTASAARNAPVAGPGAVSAATAASTAGPGASSEGGEVGASPGVVDVETEAQLLERARAALGASPSRALALTDEHTRRFPTGALAQEREVVAIQALVQSGRRDEARARAARFVAAFPGSAHRRRLEALVAP